jgi:hypothetical protein
MGRVWYNARCQGQDDPGGPHREYEKDAFVMEDKAWGRGDGPQVS